jgi:hypothetical protein
VATVTPRTIEKTTRLWSTQTGMAGGMGGVGGYPGMEGGMAGGANAGREIIDSRYVHSKLTFPLGPLVMQDWGEEVTHSKVPLAPTPEELRQRMLNAPRRMPQELEAAPEQEDGDPLDVFEQLNRNRNRRGMNGYPGGPGYEGMPGMGGYPGAPGGYGGYPGMEGSGMPGYGMNLQLQRPVPYYLLRYFDFEVEPGKNYQYRVRLVMRDPNYQRSAVNGMGGNSMPGGPPMAGPSGGEMMGPTNMERVPEKYLDKAVIERLNATEASARAYRLTDWSEPSPACQCELGEKLFAGEVNPPSRGRFYDVPSATVLLKEFNPETGMEIAVEKKLSRGDTGYLKADIEVLDPVLKLLVKKKEQAFKVNTTVLDIRGGGRIIDPRGAEAGANRTRYLSAELTEPGEVLFLDANGDLRVRVEWADREKVIFHRELAKQPELPKPQESEPGMEGMMPPGSEPMPEYGRGSRRQRRGSRGP